MGILEIPFPLPLNRSPNNVPWGLGGLLPNLRLELVSFIFPGYSKLKCELTKGPSSGQRSLSPASLLCCLEVFADVSACHASEEGWGLQTEGGEPPCPLPEQQGICMGFLNVPSAQSEGPSGRWRCGSARRWWSWPRGAS